MSTDRQHCFVCRVQWWDNLLSTQVSFALGTCAVFVPMWPTLMHLDMRARRAESYVQHVHNRVLYDLAREGVPADRPQLDSSQQTSR